MVQSTVGGDALNAFTPGVTNGKGTNNIGLLISEWGKVTDVQTGYFTISDGSGPDLKVSLPSGVTVTGLAISKYVLVTGISSVDNGNHLLKARNQADVVIVN